MDDTELEEGEACYYKDDKNIDPDIALSYIGEKLQSVLGHFQKDFEGGVSAENLGAKFGGYGSFLPAYQRSPSIRSQPKTPVTAQNFSLPKSPNVLPIEGATQNFTAPTEPVQSLRHGTASGSLHSLHTARAPLGDVLAKQGSCFSSAQETEKLLPKHEPVSNKRDNAADQRTLKVRIKLGADNIAKKNDAIYSGLGLMSPSSSMGNSPEESGGPTECQQSLDDSPNRIIRIMTSFPVPGGSLLSPLEESFLSLARKAKLLQNSKPVPAINSAQEHFAALAGDSASLMGERKVSKGKKTKIVEKSDNLVVLNQEARTDFDDNKTSVLKQEVAIDARYSVNKNPVLKQSLFNDSKLKPPSGSVCNAVDSWKSVSMDPGVPREAGRDLSVKKREVIKNGMEDTLSTGLVKEESLESISDQEGGKHEKPEARSSSTEKIFDSRLRNSHTIATDLREDGQNKGNKVSTLFKADTDVFKCKRDPTIRAMDPSRQKVGQTAACHEQYELNMSHGMGRSSSEGKKKPKGSQSNGEPASEAQESLIAEVCEAPKEKKKAGKMHKSNSRKDIRKAHDNYRDLLPETRVGEMNNQINSLERPLGDRANDSKLEGAGKEQYVSLDKSKEIAAHNKVSTQLTSETFLNEVVHDGRPPAKGVTSEMELPSVASIVIEEDWVCCDRCQKWRLLPYGTKPEQLPEKWLCSMLNWLPEMNRCDISEEETTNALHASYQLPLPESQSNLQHHFDRNAAGAPSADAWHFDRNQPYLSSHGMPNPRKKKQGSKEMPGNGGPMQTLGSTKSHRQDPLKSRCLNDMNQPILESNLMSNSDVQHSRKSFNFPMENNAHKQKEKHANNGDAKHKKQKSKREADHYGHGTAKKIRADVAFDGDKCLATEHSGNTDKISRGLPTKAALKGMEKHSEHSYSKGANSDKKEKVQISAKKEEEQASVPLHTGSLDVKTYDDREISLKKRKLKDWQESQNHVEILRNNGNRLPESKVYVEEESSDSEFRKAKKSRLSRAEGKESSTSKGGERLNKKGIVTRISLSGSRENPVQDKEEVRSIGKDHQPRKHKSKVASKPASDDIDSLKGDLGSDQFSRAATSSSSKVSDSRKSRAHLTEVKGSPVESVSSSPMRTSNLEKLSHSGKGMLGRDAARNGDFLVMDGPGRTLDGEGNIESSRSGTARMGKVSVVSHSESLGFPVQDFRDKNNNATQTFGGKTKSSVRPCEFRNRLLVNSDADNLESPFPGNLNASNHCHNEDRLTKNHYNDNSSFSEKSGKVSSLLSKEKDRSSANFERIKVKVSNPPSEIDVLNPKQSLLNVVETKAHHVLSQNEESTRLKCRNKHIKDDKRGSGKCESDSKRQNQLQFMEHDGSAVKLGALCHEDSRVTRVPSQCDLIQDFEGEVAEKNDVNGMELGGGNSQAFPHHAGKQGPSAHVPHSVSLLRKGNVLDAIPADSGNGDLSKVLKRPTNAVNPLGYPVPDQRAFKDSSSPLRRDSSSHVAMNALKEAENLRDYADRLKDSGFGFECNEAYFQAALKFLHGASLLESCIGDGSKYGEMSQMQIYGSTAKLCEICALEYEKRQEMAAAALAYKCMEVAYMKVVYCKNSSTNRDRHDLQGSLQMVPQGESPSSSASDVDNLNNQAVLDKAALSKGIGVHAGNHVILARNRPNFVRLLDFTKDVNSAMEASRKSQNAFAAASLILEEAQNKDGIICVKRVIDFSFQDVEELIRLVRLASEATSRQGFSGIKD